MFDDVHSTGWRRAGKLVMNTHRAAVLLCWQLVVAAGSGILQRPGQLWPALELVPVSVACFLLNFSTYLDNLDIVQQR